MNSAHIVLYLVGFTAFLESSRAQMQPAGQPMPGGAGAMPDIKTKFAQFTQKITAGLNQFKAQIMGTLNGLMAKKGLPPMGGAPPAADGQPAPPPAASGPLVFGQPRPNMLQPQRQNPRRMIGSSVARVNNPSRNRQMEAQQRDRINPVDSGATTSAVSANSSPQNAALTAKEDDVTAGSVKEQVSKMMDNIERELTAKV